MRGPLTVVLTAVVDYSWPRMTTIRAEVWRKICRTAPTWVIALSALGLEFGCVHNASNAGPQGAPNPAATPTPARGGDLLQVAPTDVQSAVFMLDGKPFCFTGTNNYYLPYKDKAMVDDVFAQAKSMGLQGILPVLGHRHQVRRVQRRR
jgi:hypothetical protein